jgi:hypothetical protein
MRILVVGSPQAGGRHQVGRQVPVTVVREGKTVALNVTIARLDGPAAGGGAAEEGRARSASRSRR